MILCCGEALIDMLPSPTRDGQDGYVPHAGGGIFNTAVALGRLGVKSGLVAGLSNDFFGKMLEDELHVSGVDTSLTIRSDRPTTLAFVKLENGQASYTFYDENSAGRMVRISDLPELPASTSALYCGGISLVAEPGADAFASLVEREKGRRLIMVDPNIRPGFITNEAGYRARLARIMEACDIVKVSDEDLEWLTPSHSSIDEKVGALGKAAVKIVTKGSARATAFLADGSVVEVPAKIVEVADTVGAGDTFNAGLLANLTRAGAAKPDTLTRIGKADIQHALKFAHEVAAITVARKGANPPWASELPNAKDG